MKYLLITLGVIVFLGIGFYFSQSLFKNSQTPIVNNITQPTPTIAPSSDDVTDDLTALDRDLIDIDNLDSSYQEGLKNL